MGLEEFEDLKRDFELGFERLAEEISLNPLQIWFFFLFFFGFPSNVVWEMNEIFDYSLS